MTARVPLAVVISGRGSNMQALLHASRAADAGFSVVRVIADRDTAAGLTLAREAGVASEIVAARQFADRPAFEAALAAAIRASGAHLIALAGFMRILGSEFVTQFTGRLLNIHPSLLPQYKGLDTHRRVLEAHEQWHGASVHYVTSELDGGPVLMQARLRVAPSKTPAELSARVQSLEHRIYPRVCNLIASARLAWHAGTVWYDGAPLAAPLLEE